MATSRSTTILIPASVLAAGIAAGAGAGSPGCRKARELPRVAGAGNVLAAEDVRLFVEAPVSTKEFEDSSRRWRHRVWPRFDGGKVHSFAGEDGAVVMMEAPPTMAFRNRGNDCGPAAERRVCVLPWEEVEIAVCGRPLDGHLGIRGDRLADSTIMVCRALTPQRTEKGVVRDAERDCASAAVVPIAKCSPETLSFRVGDIAVVAGSSETHDPAICDTMPWRSAGPAAPDGSGEVGR